MKTPYFKKPSGVDFGHLFGTRDIYKPLIPIVLRVNGTKQKVFSLVDSGADACLFPRDIGELLGLDVEKGKRINFLGIGNDPVPFFFHDVEILFDKYCIKTKVGFSLYHHIGITGIVGQHGFFDNFIVSFDHKNKFIEIKKHGLLG